MQNFEIAENNKFGVTLMLLDCAFSAELQRNTIIRVMTEIDSRLTEDGAPDDSESRISLAMHNARTVSNMVANREIEETEGVADIAYSFIYALGKTVGFDQVIGLRGVTGSFVRNVLSLNPCLGEIEYQQETASLQRAMVASDSDWDVDSTPLKTLH